MAGFFQSGRVDTSSVDRSKLPAGPNGSLAVYRVRVTDLADHYGPQNGDRTQINFTVISGPKAGKTGAHLVMHKADKSWKEEKARGEIAASVGAFKGFTREQSGFKITGDNYFNDVRTVEYNRDTFKVAKTSCDADGLPLVKAGAEAFLTVEGYFKGGVRKTNKGVPSVTYTLLPLSANLTVSAEFEGEANGATDDDEPLDAPVEDEPKMDALALALADGWAVNPNAPMYFYNKKTKEQVKEPALRAKYSG